MIDPARKPTSRMTWTDWRGKEQVRTIKHLVDIRDFQDTAVYPWLLMAANPHLSTTDIHRFLSVVADDFPAVERPRSWIQKRRWMTQSPDAVSQFSRPDSDGKDDQARRVIADNSSLSLRSLVALLKQHGISRGKDWVRKARV